MGVVDLSRVGLGGVWSSLRDSPPLLVMSFTAVGSCDVLVGRVWSSPPLCTSFRAAGSSDVVAEGVWSSCPVFVSLGAAPPLASASGEMCCSPGGVLSFRDPKLGTKESWLSNCKSPPAGQGGHSCC